MNKQYLLVCVWIESEILLLHSCFSLFIIYICKDKMSLNDQWNKDAKWALNVWFLTVYKN